MVRHPDIHRQIVYKKTFILDQQPIDVKASITTSGLDNHTCNNRRKRHPYDVDVNRSLCSVTASIFLNRTYNQEPENVNHPPVMEGMSVSYAMSQYIRVGNQTSNTTDTVPSNFNTSRPHAVADNGDYRYDICEATTCTDGPCVSDDYANDGIAHLANTSIRQTSNHTNHTAGASCTFEPFFALDSDHIYSPFSYIRVWFSFHTGTPRPDAGWRGGPYHVWCPPELRRFLKEAPVTIQMTHWIDTPPS
jgi:hypothetical protein